MQSMRMVMTASDEYARETHEHQELLEHALGQLYGTTSVRVAPSGLAGIASIVHGFLKRHPNGLIYTIDEVYSETLLLLASLDAHQHVSGVHEVAAADHPVLLLCESCSNPHGRVPDLEAMARVCEQEGRYLVVDNTWLSAAVFNPFHLGADLVVTSLTKYYSGGAAIAGAVLAETSRLFLDASDWLTLNGLHVSPMNCEMVHEGLLSLDERVLRSSRRTHELLQALAAIGVEAYHPLLQQPGTVERWFRTAQGTLTIPSVVLISKASVGLNPSGLVHKTSYGASDDRVEWHEEGLRLALGYDSETSPRDLISALGLSGAL